MAKRPPLRLGAGSRVTALTRRSPVHGLEFAEVAYDAN